MEGHRAIGLSGTKLVWRKIGGGVIAEIARISNPEEPYENLILGQHELAEIIQAAFLVYPFDSYR